MVALVFIWFGITDTLLAPREAYIGHSSICIYTINLKRYSQITTSDKRSGNEKVGENSEEGERSIYS